MNVAAEKQQSNLVEQDPSTSHEQPLSNAVNSADAVADMQPCSADENGQGTSREQPVDQHVDKGDAAVDKQTSNSVEINSSRGSGTLPSSTSSLRRPQMDDQKKHIQQVFLCSLSEKQ